MSEAGTIREGMEVYEATGQRLGTVERLHGEGFHVGGRHIPGAAIARVAENRVYLRETAAPSLAQTAPQGEQDAAAVRGQQAGEIRVPVAEERLQVETREAELGAVEVRKTVTEEQQTVPVELEREEVRVERRDAGERPVRPGDEAFQEDTIRVPVRGEEAVVNKEAVVTGEVVLHKEQTTERQQVADTVRQEQVEVDEDYDRHREAFRQHFAGRQGQGDQHARRTWEEAEPDYQYGYSAGRHERYRGREFDDVEADLRRDYESRASAASSSADFAHGGPNTGYEERTGRRQGMSGAGDDAWQHLREQIREGWQRARGQ